MYTEGMRLKAVDKPEFALYNRGYNSDEQEE